MTTYSLDLCVCAIGGVPIHGAGDGGFCEFTRDAEEWENVKCVDGHVVSCANLDKSVTGTITLRYDSPSNGILQIFALTRATVPFIFQAPNGDAIMTDECRIQKRPDLSFGQTPGERVWSIFLDSPLVQFSVGSL